jgi:HAE1 family hydrophobic/amphiphilic exporter-1
MSLAEFATRRRVTVAMVTLTFVIFGVIALFGLRVNLLPDLSYPTLTVRTEYTGAAPAEIETLISEPVEEAVGVVKNLRKLKSISRTGQSDVVMEFAWGTFATSSKCCNCRWNRRRRCCCASIRRPNRSCAWC